MNFWVYAIRSDVDGRIYVGMSEDVERRLIQHNNGKTRSTKGYIPWQLIYKEYAGSSVNAREREKYLKSGIGKDFLKRLAP